MTESKYQNLIFVDCESSGISPVNGTLTEFGAVNFGTRQTFYGQLFTCKPDPANPAVSIVGDRVATDEGVATRLATWLKLVKGGRPVFVSDNPAWDFMWIAGMFDKAGLPNPFGHSGRRISDFWAGFQVDWSNTQKWKHFRKTKHDHNPVNDAMGNVEAFDHILEMMGE
jgi:hypothetical protein